MKVVAIVQARVGSTRLPNKVIKSIVGKPMIELLLTRLSRAQEINEIVVATSEDPRNQPLVELVRKLGYRWCWAARMMCWIALCKLAGKLAPKSLCASQAIVPCSTRNWLMLAYGAFVTAAWIT